MSGILGDPAKEVIDTAERLDGLATGSLVVACGMFLVFGVVLSVLWFAPGVGAAALLALRYKKHQDSYAVRKNAEWLDAFDSVRERKELLQDSNLPEEEKGNLSRMLNEFMDQVELPKADKTIGGTRRRRSDPAPLDSTISTQTGSPETNRIDQSLLADDNDVGSESGSEGSGRGRTRA